MLLNTELSARWAQTVSDLEACQRLRYRIFVQELGGDGALVSHDSQLERDSFDRFARHLMVEDTTRPAGDRLIATARLLDAEGAEKAGGFYSETEFDLSGLKSSGQRLMELGRTCLDLSYRRSPALHMMKALVAEAAQDAEVLFGAASFAGADPMRHHQPLSWLWYNRRLRGVARQGEGAQPWLLPQSAVDGKAAMLQMPPLLKSYLKMGAEVGEAIFVDQAFNCVDVLVLLDPRQMSGALSRTLRLSA